jgi:hypothetical protein
MQTSAPWTAVVALVVALVSGGYSAYALIRGPRVIAFPMEQVVLSQRDDGRLAAIAMPELTNATSTTPDVITSQSIRVLDGQTVLVCMSVPSTISDAAASTRGVASLDETPDAPDAPRQAEFYSPRTQLPGSQLFSRRQRFDQGSHGAEANPCYGVPSYSANQFMRDNRGKAITLRYEAELAFADGVYSECDFVFDDNRFLAFQRDGLIDVTCEHARTGKLSVGFFDGVLGGIKRLLLL